MENSNIVPQHTHPTYPNTPVNRAQLDAFLKAKHIELTTDQKAAISSMVDFLEDAEQHLFVLQGSAGTGKTFVLSLAQQWLSAQHRDHKLLAPTGKAMRVLAQKTQSPCFTTHSFLYQIPPVFQETPPELRKHKPEFQWIFNRKTATNLDLKSDTVVIVDEASLISDIADDSNYYQFGSGRLLFDLLEALDFASYPQRKVIFCGDPAQLPPVNMKFSPVFNTKHLRDNYGLSAISCFQLKEVVRQGRHSTILRNATQLRDQIEQHNFITLQFALNEQDCQQIEATELVESYLKYCHNHRFSFACIITGTNAAAHDYNGQVRAKRGFSATNLQHNDLLIISRNNQLYQLFNGDFALVDAVSNELYSQQSFFSRQDHTGKQEQCKLTLNFQKVTLTVYSTNGTKEQKQVLLMLNFLFEDDEGVTSENLTQALITNCNMRFDVQFPPRHQSDFATEAEFQDYQHKRRAQRKEFMRNDSYLNCLYAKFGYAITCHKAQGSEWQRVYVDCTNRTNGGNKANEDRCRWLYTAITRAKSELRLINPPHITLGQRFRFSNTPHANGSAAANATYATSTGSSCAASVTAITPATNYSHATDATTTPEANSDTTVASAFASTETTGDTSTSATAAYHTTLVPSSAPFHHPSAPQDYFESLLRKALSGFAITNIAITDANYLKACTISTPDGTFIVNVYYNGKSRITKVYAEAKVLQKFAPQLQALQQQLLQQSILPPQTATITPAAIKAEMASLTPQLQDIGARACDALVKHQLVITSLQVSHPHKLRFEVQAQDDCAFVEFDLCWGKNGGSVQWVERKGCTTSLKLKQLVTDIISKL